MTIMIKIILLLLIAVLFQCKSIEKNVDTVTLENTYWRLAEINGKSLVTPTNAREVHIMLSNTETEKHIKGFAGCNAIAGSYSIVGKKIHFIVITTRMFCQDQMDIEDFFTSALTKTETYTIQGDELTLFQGNAKLTMLKAVYFK